MPFPIPSWQISVMNFPLYASRAALALALSMAGSCHLLPDMPDPLNFAGAKARNLEALHSTSGEYNYRADTVGDLGYLFEEIIGTDRLSSFAASPVANPSGETMVNILDLLACNPDDSDTVDLQIEWCARLCATDPSALVRERAATGLGELGVFVDVKSLPPLPASAGRATPDEIGAVIESVLRGLRAIREEDDSAPLELAVADGKALYLNGEGGWRLLAATRSLRKHASDASSLLILDGLSRHLRKRLIEEGVRTALADSSDLVQAAGLRSLVTIHGPVALSGFLNKPRIGWSDTIVVGLVDLVAQYGLPVRGTSPEVKEAQLTSLLEWAVDHPAARVRVRSMIALQRVAPDGPRSLREEDWHTWGLAIGARPGSSS